MRRLVTLIALVALNLTACSRRAADDAQSVLDRATTLYTTEGPKHAIPEFERALTLFRAAGDRAGEATSLSRLGNATKASGHVEKGIVLLRQALAIHRDVGNHQQEGRTLNNLGLAHYTAGEYDEAMKQLDQALAIAGKVGDRQLSAAALNNSGMVLDELGDYRSSLARYEQALATSREIGDPRVASDALGNIGGVSLLLGRFREAADRYRESYAISEREGLKPGMSKDLGNLASALLELDEVPEAIAAFDRAIAIAREAGLPSDEADWQAGRGRALVRLGKYDQALSAYESALNVYEREGLQRERVGALLDRGALLLSMGSDDGAEHDFTAATAGALAIGYARGNMLALLALGDLEARRTRSAEALMAYRRALEASSRSGESALEARGRLQISRTLASLGRLGEAEREAQRTRELGRETGAQSAEAHALLVLVRVAREQRRAELALQLCAEAESMAAVRNDPELRWRFAFERGRTLEGTGRLDDAFASYRDAVDTLDGVRGELQDIRLRSGYLLDKKDAYSALVRVLIRLGRSDAAFEAAERLRARWSPLDGATGAVAQTQTPVARQLRARIARLQVGLESETARVSSERRRQAITTFSEELAAAQAAYAIETGRASAGPGSAPPPSSVAIRRLLPRDTVLLEFIVSEQETARFMVTRGHVEATLIPVARRDLQARIELLRDLIERPDSSAWVGPASALHDILLPKPDALGHAGRLLLVPNDVLHYLPFAVLSADTAGSSLLIDRFDLAYLPSAASLALPPARSAAGGALLALAPARSRLPHATLEVETIAALHQRSRILLGAAATETTFKREAPEYHIVHLATHGFFNRPHPMFSGVELEPGAHDDGRLEVHEILQLRLRASLVTLSACRTALGGGQMADIPPGDEFVGLTQAFLKAGSTAVLASLWDLDDQAAAGLMEAFYRRLTASGPGSALASAQREVRRRGDAYAHPYYWAAMVLVTSAPDSRF